MIAMRSSDQNTFDEKLSESLCQEAKRVAMAPASQLNDDIHVGFAHVVAEALNTEADEHYVTAPDFAKAVGDKLIADYPDSVEHIAWFKRMFKIAD